MSMSYTSRTTPRSSATQGRIVTENTALSAILRENTKETLAPAPHTASVDSPALDVVSSDIDVVNVSNSTPNTQRKQSVQYVVVSKSVTSLKAAANSDHPLSSSQNLVSSSENISDTYNHPVVESDNRALVEPEKTAELKSEKPVEFESEKPAELESEKPAEFKSEKPAELESEKQVEIENQVKSEKQVESEKPVEPTRTRNSSPSNAYAYRSLKSTHHSEQVSRVNSKTNFVRDVDVTDNLHVTDKVLTHSSDSVVVVNGSSNTNSAVNVLNSSENKETAGDNNLAHNAPENSSRHITHSEHSPEHSKVIQQNTGLSLYSQHERVDRSRTPLRVNTQDQIVPPLDLSDFNKTVSDKRVDSPYSVDKLKLSLEDQNLHASDRNSIVHFSSRDYNPTNRTYGVKTPVHDSELPVINSYDNFRQDEEQDTYRDRQQGPDALEPNRSDLADNLRVPYPFDTQASDRPSSREQKPPSPPVQTTPPPNKEPATSLHSGNNVYAVANPDILRAQGIEPPADNHWTPRHQNQGEVRFDRSSDHNRNQSGYGGSPVKDRPPTPYAKSPEREELPRSPADWDVPIEEKSREQSNASKSGLPPQHPPLDTLHSKPGSRSSKRLDDNQSVKRVYVESPSFTKEEEEEYRFVSSRLEDTDDKNQGTFRAMDNRGYGGDDRPNNDYRDNNRMRKSDNDFDRRTNEKDRYGGDRYEEQNRGRNDRETDMNRYEDRSREMNGYHNDKDRENYYGNDRDRQNNDERDRYGGGNDRYNRGGSEKYSDSMRNRERDSYGQQDRYSENDRYARGGSEKYSASRGDRDRDPYGRSVRYDSLRDERDEYEREPRRDDEPNFGRGYGKQNTELEDGDLQKETEYQKDLKRRIDKQGKKLKDSDKYTHKLKRDSYDKENDFARDSLEYDDRDRGQERDSYNNYNNYDNQRSDWDNPPQNPYHEQIGQNPYQEDRGYYANQGGFTKQDSRPDFYDPEDVEKMEIVNPKAPRYDYVEKNKQDYGKNPPKSYRDIVHKKKEEEEKLDTIFITPKVPPKGGKKKPKKAQSAQPQHMGHQPPEQFPMGFKPSSAEELWAQKARVLQQKKGSATSNKPAKTSASKSMPRWNANNQVKPALRYENPAPMPNQGQLFRPGNMPPQPNYSEQPNYSQQQQGGYHQTQQQGGYSQSGYGTPTRQLQPLENRPAPPVSTEMVPTAVQPASPFRRHMELKPISQEITTEDGQRISVDINLRLISPPPGQSGPGSPTQTQQLALVPVQETHGPGDHRGVGVPYQMQDTQPGNYDGYNTGYEQGQMVPYDDGGYNDQMPMDSMKYDNQQYTTEDLALVDPTGYSKKYQTSSSNYRDEQGEDADTKSLEEGYASIYHKMKTKDPSEHPWYKVYNIHDYKKMQREVRLNRGTLGPDLDTESYKDKMEKRHKQFEYARMVMEKNRMELGSKKPPKFPRQNERETHEGKRRQALEYAKNVPKPQVKPRPNQYNSYEVAAQLTPGSVKTRSPYGPKGSPTPTQTVDMIDIRTLEQRHLQERQKADKIRQNMDSVLSPKAQKAH
ncbi:hypothetical protein ACF0H5_011766 [Mactra antiquata]